MYCTSSTKNAQPHQHYRIKLARLGAFRVLHFTFLSSLNSPNINTNMVIDLEQLPDAPNSTVDADAPAQLQSKKRQRPSNKTPTTQFSIRKPTWAYIRLQHLSPNNGPADLDNMTAHMHLNAAMSSFLGLHGSAITFDILKLQGQDVWIRVRSEDRAAVVAASGGWVSKLREGWRVRSWSHWNALAVGRDAGQDLFDD